MKIIDFHNHHVSARYEQAVVQAAPAKQRVPRSKWPR